MVICAAIKSSRIIESLGHNYPMVPILGQVLDLELNSEDAEWKNWPAVISIAGINLIPQGKNRLLVGATIEEGSQASEDALKKLKALNGKAPNWLKEASVVKHWHGIRAKPIGQSSPLLIQLEKGLILASGHYRNGILLAPATAEWVANQLAINS